ncbi:recombination regulator RecX [Clostridium sp. MT-14]|uniref:Regulatory protein RecX n=1 Tax=Clostridium aromativorans TaxID=2836848 RepID=A0ABS8N0N3_9CLOT|nr:MULTISPECIES: recombination regulator RecX [Clostridium]KAA8674338.1 recombination regulator RecX [Clostridium sp. HV4-5-A1G]MCC9293352.1 recombination regulator RecX [Clostridium aromativorans]CAB1252212.1 Regulatory protein RecX [Clostridiaceae bacterium BL-3]
MDKHVITKIEVQRRNREKANVYVDGEFAFSCDLELIYTFNIFKGKIVDIEYLKSVAAENNYMRCKNSALKVLEKTYKTEKQMEDKLLEKQYDEETVAKVMDFLKKYGFIDDNKFVELYIKEKINFQGRNKIKYSLMKKGIEENLLNEKLNSIDNCFEEKTALNIAQKKYDAISKNENSTKIIYKKLGDYLTRKGYDYSIVKDVLRKILNKCDDFNRKDERIHLSENDIDKLYNIAQKRYQIAIKSEEDRNKIYRKIGTYLLRRGYLWEDIKKVLGKIMEDFSI